MMKKWIAMVLVLVLYTAAACASEVPSKTTTDIASAVQVTVSAQDVTPAETFTVQLAQDSAPVAQEIDRIYAQVMENNQPVITCFPADVQQAVETALPEGTDVNELQMNEFVAIEEVDYDPAYGDVTVNFQFATPYTPDQQLVALCGLYSGEVDEAGQYVAEWMVLSCQVAQDGTVQVLFPQDVLSRFAQCQSVALAILSK